MQGYPLGMIVLAAIVLGAALGFWRAAKLGGNRADRLQYAAAHALGFAALGIVVTVLLSRIG